MKKSLNSLFAQEADTIDCCKIQSADPKEFTPLDGLKSPRSTEDQIHSLKAEIEILNSKLSEAQKHNREITEEKEILEGLNKEMESQLTSFKNQALSFKSRLSSYKEKAGNLSRKNSEMQIELYELNIERDRMRQKSNTKKLHINQYTKKLNKYKYKTKTLREEVKQKTVELDFIKTENFKESIARFESIPSFKAKSQSRFQPPRPEEETPMSRSAGKTLKFSLQSIVKLKFKTEEMYKELMKALPTNSSKVQELELKMNGLIEQFHDTKECLEDFKLEKSPKKTAINRICRILSCNFD